MQMFWQTQLKPDQFTQPRCAEAPDYYCEREYKYGTSKLCIPVVIQLKTDDDVVPPEPTAFVEVMEHLQIVPGVSGLPQGTSRPPNSHRRIRSGMLHTVTSIHGVVSPMVPDLSLIQNATPVELITFHT